MGEEGGSPSGREMINCGPGIGDDQGKRHIEGVAAYDKAPGGEETGRVLAPVTAEIRC